MDTHEGGMIGLGVKQEPEVYAPAIERCFQLSTKNGLIDKVEVEKYKE